MGIINILLAAPKSGRRGGIARWTGHLLDYYQSLNCHEIQLALYDTAEKVRPARSGFFYRWYRALLGYSQVAIDLRKEFLKQRYDILHFTSSASLGLIRDWIIIRVAHRRKVKAIVHFRFGRIPQLAEQRNWEWFMLSKVIKCADNTIVIDKASFNTLIRAGFERVQLLPNPLTHKVQQILDKSGAIQREDKTILFVGHCYKDKGVYELINACKEMSDIKLKYVGSIDERIKKDLMEIANNRVEVCFIGEEPYEDIIKDMSRCDIFALPSYTEGFPNVILEAMASGCAIVATAVGAIPEMLEEDEAGMYGLVVEPKNVEELKEAIERFLNDTSLKEECQKNAKRRVYERYAISSVWEQMVRIWNQTL